MREKFNLCITASLAILIAYLSLTPRPSYPSSLGELSPTITTLIYHSLAYAALSTSAAVTLRERDMEISGAVIGAAAYGLLIEIAQIQVAGRFFTYPDIVANTAGASLVIIDYRFRFLERLLGIQEDFIEIVAGANR